MCSFVNEILAHHLNKEEYLLGADGLSVEPAAHPSTEKKVASTTLLLQRAVELRHAQGFSSEDVRKLACCAYQAVRQLFRSPKISSEQIKRKEEEAFWNLIGHDGVRQENNETRLFEKLVVANHIHYIVNRLGVFNGGEAVSILVNGQWVRISELSQKNSTNGIEFYHKGALVFRTKNDYILDEYFFCGDRGIVPGTPSLGTPEVIDTGVVSVPADASYHVIVGTALVSQESPRLLGDHGYLGLVDTNGRVTYFGQFGMVDSPGSGEAVAPCAHKPVGIEAYDRYIALPFTSYHVKETKLQISKEQYEQLKEIAKRDIKQGRSGSFLEDNCSGYVVQTLQKVGVQATARMTSSAWLWKWSVRKVFSRSWSEKILRRIDSQPKWVVLALHFVPIFYIPNLVLGGLLRSFMSYEKKLGYRNLFHIRYFLQAAFCPWTLFINHPLALRAWQITQEKSPHGH